MRGVPPQEAPNLPDATLDDIVSSINVEREQIGPNRYIADLGILFDRARAAQYLGVEGGEVQRSVPMLLIPITVTAGTSTSVELRNAWQRAWAQFRTSQSPIDYVRVSGLGADPMLVNASQTIRPGRGWWRNIIDYYGAADILVAEVQVQRLYPGGPARARFIARHGPDNEIVGGFTLTAANSDALPQMMAEGVRRMALGPDDGIFFAAGKEEDAAKLAGAARARVGEQLDLIEKGSFRFCWIVDFPMFEYNDEQKKIDFSHNPFSMPQGEMEALTTKDPLDILAWQYDIVCNGVELSSGAIRNHRPDIMTVGPFSPGCIARSAQRRSLVSSGQSGLEIRKCA